MMKDVSLKGKTGISNERIVNKIQDFIWDDVLSRYGVPRKFHIKFIKWLIIINSPF